MWFRFILAVSLFAAARVVAQLNITYTNAFPNGYGDWYQWDQNLVMFQAFGLNSSILELSNDTLELHIGSDWWDYTLYQYANKSSPRVQFAFEWFYPYGNYDPAVDINPNLDPHKYTQESLRVQGDGCGFFFFERVSQPPPGITDMYKIVRATSDPSGLGPVFFDYQCPANQVDNGEEAPFTGWTSGANNYDRICTDLHTMVVYDGNGQYYDSYHHPDVPEPGNTRGYDFWYVVPWAQGATSAIPQPPSPAQTLVLSPMLPNYWLYDPTIPDNQYNGFIMPDWPWFTSTYTDDCTSIPPRTYLFDVTTSVTATTTDSAGSQITTAVPTTYTTRYNSAEAYSYTRSISSVSRLSSISARSSSLSAASVSRVSSRSVASASRASVRSTHSVAVVAHSVSLASARSSKTSVQSVHSSTLAANRASRSSVDATHYATLSLNRASRSSFNQIHYSTLSANRVSRSSVRQSKSDARSRTSVSKSLRSNSVSSSKLAASLSRDSARSAATLSKSIASVSRESARSVASSSLSAARASRSSANSVLSASRLSANSVLSVSRASRSVSIASVASERSVSAASVASVRSVSDASVASVRSVSSVSAASVSSASAASAASASASPAGVAGRRRRVAPVAPTAEDLAMITPAPVAEEYYYEEVDYYEEENEFEPRDYEDGEDEFLEGVDF